MNEPDVPEIKKTHNASSLFFRIAAPSDVRIQRERFDHSLHVPPGSPLPDRGVLKHPEIRKYAER